MQLLSTIPFEFRIFINIEVRYSMSEPNNEDKDPFNFFKLAPDSNKPDDNSDNKKPKIPYWGIMLIIVGIIMIINLLFMVKQDTTIPFSEFRAMIESGQIVSVDLGETHFIGYFNSSETPSASSFPIVSLQPWQLIK